MGVIKRESKCVLHHITSFGITLGENAITMKRCQTVKSTNYRHKEGRQSLLPSTPHSRVRVSGESLR